MLSNRNSRTGTGVAIDRIESSATRNRTGRDEEDSVRLYLTDIGQYPLLTKDDEVRLAQAIEAGMAARQEMECPDGTLTPARKRELRRAHRKGEESERTFVQSNLRLVVSIAKKYQASGLPLLDLIQEGNLGLMHAVEKFDWRKGFKFSTYATWWIRQAITRGIANTGRTIRLPVHAGDTLARLQKARSRLELKHGRPASLADLAAEVEMPKKDVEQLWELVERLAWLAGEDVEELVEHLVDLSEEKITEALRFASEPLSLSEPPRDDGDAELDDMVEDRSAESPFDVAATSPLLEEIDRRLSPSERSRKIDTWSVSTDFTDAIDGRIDGKNALAYAQGVTDSVRQKLASMSYTEKLIIEHRLSSKNKTLDELGQLAGLSRERIRQLEKTISQVIEESIGVEIDRIASNLTKQMGPVITTTEFDRWINSTFYDKDAYLLESRLARGLLKKRLNYKCVRDKYIDSTAVKIVEQLEEAAIKLADDVGLIDEEALRDYLPSSKWEAFFSALLDCCEFYQVSGQLAIRDTAKVKVKAALLEIGRPATKEEIASVAKLDPNRISGQLSALPSVARSDKFKWGLKEWIEDVYEGIPAEIIQRIKENGGATTLDRLLDELPRLFNVSESSIRTYIGTPQFVMQDGKVRLREQHEPYTHGNTDVQTAPGVFSLGLDCVSLLYKVDKEVLRGSGRKLSAAAGSILRLAVSSRLRFVDQSGITVTVTFPETSASGPLLGSTKALAESSGAKLGDFLTIILDPKNGSVTATATDASCHSPSWNLVARLTGINEEASIDSLANALNCRPGEVRATLRKRGDWVVLDALPHQQPSNDLVEALAELDAEMERSRL